MLTIGSAQPGNFHAGFECHSGSCIGTVMLCEAILAMYEQGTAREGESEESRARSRRQKRLRAHATGQRSWFRFLKVV